MRHRLFTQLRIAFSALALSSACGFATAKGHGGDVSVHSYTKSNGTVVASHHRSAPDGDFWNNWSTKGNRNPYTGAMGTRVTPPQNGGVFATSGPVDGGRIVHVGGNAANADFAPANFGGGAADDPGDTQPTPGRNPIIRTKPDYATDHMDGSELKDHDNVATDIAGSGVHLSWKYYDTQTLHALDERIETANRINQLGVSVRWEAYSQIDLNALERKLESTDPEDRQVIVDASKH